MTPKRKKLDPSIQKQLEQERLNAPINPSGQGEDEVVKALLSPEFVKMTDMDAGQIVLLLQQLIRGQNSILARVDSNEEELRRFRERMEKNDKQLAVSLSDSQKQLQEIYQQAEKLKATGSKKDKIIAQGSQMFQKAVQDARAQRASDKLLFEDQLAHMEQVTVIAPGQFVQVREGQSVIPKLLPTEIRIKHKVWYLQPGQPTNVPKVVAERLFEMLKSQGETAKLKTALSKIQEQGKLAQEWNDVEGSKRQALPLA